MLEKWYGGLGSDVFWFFLDQLIWLCISFFGVILNTDICIQNNFKIRKLYFIYFILFNKKLIFDTGRIYLLLICLQLNTLILGDVKQYSCPPPFSDFMVWKSDKTSLILCTGWKNKGDFFIFCAYGLFLTIFSNDICVSHLLCTVIFLHKKHWTHLYDLS